MNELIGKTAIITGGAAGIGAAAAMLFAREGGQVAIVDLNDQAGESLARKICALTGQKAVFIKADISKRSGVEDVFDNITRHFGRLNILYNNASIYLPGEDGPVTEIAETVWDKILAVNLKSVYLFCKYAIPLLREAGGGSIINTASNAGVIGIPGCDAYTASKGATVQLTKSMAVEYGRFNIRVNCIAPAAIRTPMLAASNLDDDTFDEQAFLKLRAPLRRYGSPEEIAQTALFLASGRSSYLNGAVIVADGGITVNGDLSKIPVL